MGRCTPSGRGFEDCVMFIPSVSAMFVLQKRLEIREKRLKD
jgi:hypothetical protein